MRRFTLLFVGILMLCSASVLAYIPRYSTNPHDFVSSHLGHFWVNGQPFRFVGFNMRAFVHYGYNDIAGGTTHADKSTNLFEMQQWGAKVARVFVPYRELTFQQIGDRLDAALHLASQYNIRLIVTLTDSYAVTVLYPPGDFQYHTQKPGDMMNEYWYEQAYQVNYKPMVLYLVNRFKNDPTVFCWQLGNEMKCPWEFSGTGNDLLPFCQDMTASIRAIDPIHMISLGSGGSSFALLDHTETRQVNQLFDFLTVHTYNEDDSEASDAALAIELGKPLVISEAGMSSSIYNHTNSTRANATDRDVAKWIGRGARGYMNWAFCALNRDAGDADRLWGIDKVLHADWNYYKTVYSNWASTLSSTPRPAPEKPTNVQASDGTYSDRVEITWNEAWAANEYCVYRSEPLADPNAVVNVMPYVLSYVECGHCDVSTTVEKMHDGNTATRWCCNHNSGAAGDHNVYFDLGSTAKVSKFVIKHASSNGIDPASLNTNQFYIYSGTSINGPWTQEYFIYNAQMLASHTLTLSTPKDIRYVRLRILKPNPSTDYTARIQEFEVWGIPSAGLTRRISDWQTARSFIDTTATPGVNYHYTVNARNEAGESGSSLDDIGFAAVAQPVSIREAKGSTDGSSVYVTGGVVSAVYNGRFYLEQPDRASGIMVVWSGAVTEGSSVNVAGTISAVDGERRIAASAVTAAQ